MRLGRFHRALWMMCACCLGMEGAVQAETTERAILLPQVKINHIDTSDAPTVRVYASFLDRNMRPVEADRLVDLAIYRKPPGEKAKRLFGFVDGEVLFPEDGTDAVAEEPPPTLMRMDEADRGSAIAVVMPGYADPAYRDGVVGERMRSSAELFFKKLGATNRMNILWYSDEVWSWVKARGRTRELSVYSEMKPACDAWAQERLEEGPVEDAEGQDPTALLEGESVCGLMDEYESISEILSTMSYEGCWPHLFGLEMELCRPAECARRARQLQTDDGDDAEGETPDPAIEVALRMIAEAAEPGQPRMLILLGDGQDGYAYRLSECRAAFEADCRRSQRGKGYQAYRGCVDERLSRQAIAEQQAFRGHAMRWIGFAKSAGIRIHTIINPNASHLTSERLELLALRTGGTARQAMNANGLTDLYTDLVEEINGQHLITFVDERAMPGETVSYEVRLKARARGTSLKRKSAPFDATIAPVPSGLTVFMADKRAMMEATLGSAGTMAVLIGVLLVLALLLFGFILKFVKK
jgi:hypothetical protein